MSDRTEVSITGGGDPERVQALEVSAATVPLLRVQPVVGRGFMLTSGYWQRRFGGVEDVVGQAITIDGRRGEIIGVLPASFTFLRTRPEVVLPMPLDAITLFAKLDIGANVASWSQEHHERVSHFSR